METVKKIIEKFTSYVIIGAILTAAAFICTAFVDSFVFTMGLGNTIILLVAIFSVLSYKLSDKEEK